MIDFRENLVRNVDRKFFTFRLVDRYELESRPIQTGVGKGGRAYLVPGPDGGLDYVAYKSVTTIISEHADKTWLKEWRERVGDAEADAVMQRALFRGTTIHDMAEAYFMGEEYWKGHGTVNIIDFNRVVPLLNESVTSIYGVELPLYSHRLRTAGRADLVCQWNHINSVVDFKTSRRDKLQEEIKDYFIQATCYAMMFQETYNLTIPQICVIILIDHEPEPKVFIEKTEDWVDDVERMFIEDHLGIPADVYNDI